MAGKRATMEVNGVEVGCERHVQCTLVQYRKVATAQRDGWSIKDSAWF